MSLVLSLFIVKPTLEIVELKAIFIGAWSFIPGMPVISSSVFMVDAMIFSLKIRLIDLTLAFETVAFAAGVEDTSFA